MNKTTILAVMMLTTAMTTQAQEWQVPVLENDEPMATGQFTPDWASLRTY